MKKKSELNQWIKKKQHQIKMKVVKTSISKIENWVLSNKEIYNKKRNFFSIKPFQIQVNKKKKWFQPLIIQKEVGILGIIKKKIDLVDHYLLQAKVEPGNINKLQLSPTVQATKSNYLQKHGGKKTNYLEYFIKTKSNIKVITSLKLSEQGTRYLNKANRNILVDVKNKKIEKNSNYIWLSKENIIYLLGKKNLLNMDTISVFSSAIKKNFTDFPVIKLSIIIKKLNNFKKKNKIFKKAALFNELKKWKIFKDRIEHIKKLFFSILFINVKTNSREVKEWSQPLISDYFNAYNAFLLKRVNNTTHYFLQIILEPGFNSPMYTTTISLKNFDNRKNYSNVEFLHFFKKKNLTNFTYSDEGGRFFKNESINSIYFLKNDKKFTKKNNFIWVSHNQIIDLIKKNLLTIEARNLFACFNIDKIH